MTAIDRGRAAAGRSTGPRPGARGTARPARDFSVGRDVEHQVDHAGVVLPVHRVPGVDENPDHRVFSASTSAVNRRIPLSCAAAARCSSRIEPRPRRCWASSTTNATSAASVSPAGVPVVGAGRDDLARRARRPGRPRRRCRRSVNSAQLLVRDLVDDREVPQVQRSRAHPAVHRADRRRRPPGPTGAGARPRRRPAGRRPPSAAGRPAAAAPRARSVTRVVRIQPVQRVDRVPGVRIARSTASSARPSHRLVGHRHRSCPSVMSIGMRDVRAGPARPSRSSRRAAGSPGRGRVRRRSPAGGSRPAAPPGPGQYPPPPSASQRPPVIVSASVAQRQVGGPLPVHGQVQVGQRILPVGVRAVLGDQHLRPEGARPPPAPPRERRAATRHRRCPAGNAMFTAVPCGVAAAGLGRPAGAGEQRQRALVDRHGQHPRVVVERVPARRRRGARRRRRRRPCGRRRRAARAIASAASL